MVGTTHALYNLETFMRINKCLIVLCMTSIQILLCGMVIKCAGKLKTMLAMAGFYLAKVLIKPTNTAEVLKQ